MSRGLQKFSLLRSSPIFCSFRNVYLSHSQDSVSSWPSTNRPHKYKSQVKSLCISQQQCLSQCFLFKFVGFSTKSNKNVDDLIIVFGQDDSVIGIKTKTEATQLARKKNMRLMKLENETAHKKYPVYRLITASCLIKEEEKTQKKEQPEEKNITFSYKISNHDLHVKINSIEKWLRKKNCQVKVFVTGETGKEQALDELYDKIESHFGNTARLLQKVMKNGNMKFYILRPKETERNMKA